MCYITLNHSPTIIKVSRGGQIRNVFPCHYLCKSIALFKLKVHMIRRLQDKVAYSICTFLSVFSFDVVKSTIGS